MEFKLNEADNTSENIKITANLSALKQNLNRFESIPIPTPVPPE